METNTAAPVAGGGLQTALDIIVAPKTAFAALRAVPTWGWAFAIASVLAVVGSLLAVPASRHIAAVTVPAAMARSPQIAAMPPVQRDEMIARQTRFAQTASSFNAVVDPIVVLLVALMQAVVMLVANAVAHGDGSFKRLWALSIHTQIVGYGLGAIAIGAVALLRGADAYASQSDVYTSMPSLAWFVPSASPPTIAILATFNVFYLWAAVLLVMGMMAVARIPRTAAIAAAVVMLLGTAAIGAGFASLARSA